MAVEETIREDLERQLAEPVVAVRSVPEGHSGFTYWVELNGGRAVLRVPPPGANIRGPADIPRQGRLMRSLHDLGLPVPEILAMSDQPVVDGRPFLLMEAVAGDPIEVAIEKGLTAREAAGAAVDVLKQMQAIDPGETAIGNEDPVPLRAELVRWGWLMDRSPEELVGGAPRLAALLQESIPADQPPVLVHGDFHFRNMVFRDGKVAAVLDWEIAQLGQPLLDPCCICVAMNAGGDEEVRLLGPRLQVSSEEMRELLGAAPTEFRWSLALTYYKYAAIFGYNLMLHRRGKRPDPSYEARTGDIVQFIEDGTRLLSGAEAAS